MKNTRGHGKAQYELQTFQCWGKCDGKIHTIGLQMMSRHLFQELGYGLELELASGLALNFSSHSFSHLFQWLCGSSGL